jgi:hypothetical protein
MATKIKTALTAYLRKPKNLEGLSSSHGSFEFNNLSNCTHCCVETLIIFSVLPLDATLAKN